MNIEMNKKTVALVVGVKMMAVLLGSVFLAAPALADDEKVFANMTTLDVSSQVDIKATPDIADVSAGVVTSSKTAQEALKENATKMNAVFTALKTAGIAEKDIQTSGINVSPQYMYQENKAPQITGYQATNNVNVKLHDLKNIGKVLDTLVAQGANQLNGPNFSVENPDVVLDEARKDAVVKARKRADLYAQAAGLKVKRIVTISENVQNAPPMPYPVMAKRMMAADSAAGSPVATGEVGLSVTVNVTYELTE